MAKFDERNNAEYALGFSGSIAGTTASNGNIIDVQGFEALTFTISTGAVSDAGTTAGFGFKLQESDTTAAADFTDVAAADLVGLLSDLTVTSDSDDNIIVGSIGYVGGKRYVRLVATGTTGTSAAITAHATKRRGAVQGSATKAANIAAT